MNIEISNKNTKLRNELRKKQLEEYFRQRRMELVKSPEQEADQAFNQQVSVLIAKDDVQMLYQKIYIDECVKKLNSLTEQNCLNLFTLLAKNIQAIDAALLLKPIIEVNYKIIFLNRANEQFNKQFVYVLYEKIEQKVHSLSNQSDEKNRKIIYDNITIYLDCIRALIWSKMEQNEDGYIFDEVFNQLLMKGLWANIRQLYMNPLYLLIIALSQLEYNFSANEDFQEFLYSNQDILHKLIQQVDLENNKRKSLAMPSILIVNAVLKNLTLKRDLINSILPAYLQKVKLVYSSSQQNANRFFRITTFYDMFDNINLFFEFLSQEILEIHLGQMLTKTNFWTFSYMLLRIETQHIRKQVYTLLRHTVANMVINKAKLQCYISQSLIPFIVEGLESDYAEIIAQNLEIAYFLVHYSHEKSSSDVRFLEDLEESGISTSLENLEYFKNEEIAQKATALSQLINQSNRQMIIQE